MLKLNIQNIKEDIKECCLKCNRKVEDIKLLAVSKTHPVDIIQDALQNGIEYIAENKIQECELKLPSLKGRYKEFHFIGHLQSNKINKLLALNPDLIHSIDKLSTAEKLNNALKKINKVQNILIEVNTSGEESKNGVSPDDVNELIKRIDDLEFLRIKGLMTIGALTEEENKIRSCFKLLREIFEKEKMNNFNFTKMESLSMGMSGDYKIAIEEGTHIIRLGSIIFGNRIYTQ